MNQDNINSENKKGGALNISKTFFDVIAYCNSHVLYLNNSKFFAGVVMILLNVGSKFITIQFSKSAEEYLKYTVSKQILIFAMAWMGTRDIYAALGLTAVFTILSDYLFNEDSSLCIVPKEYRILDKLVDSNLDGEVTATELSAAIAVLEKAKKDKEKKEQKIAFSKFDFEKYNYDK